MSNEVLDKKHKLLLEYLISDRSVFIKCIRIIKPSYFEPPLDRVVENIVEFFGKHHNIPNVDIIEAETGILLKERLMEVGDESYFLDEFEQHCKEQAMTEAILAAVEFINDGNTSPIQDLVRNALLVRIDDSLGTNLFDDPEERIKNMMINVDERTCGIPAVDDLIGKIRRGELGVFFAATAGGKSVTLANLVRNVSSQGLSSLIVTIELNELLYSKRLDAILTSVDIKDHAMHAGQIAEELARLAPDFGNIIIKKMPYGTTPADIRALVMEYVLKYGKPPDALFVDYLGLMGGAKGKGMNKFDEDEIKAFGIRDLCVEYDMYGFTAGQINRDGYDVKTLGPNHVAGGISVINACDWAVGLVATEEDIDNNQVQAIQMKIRNGGKTTKPAILYRCPRTLVLSDQPTVGKATTPLKTTNKNPAAKTTTPAGGRSKLKEALGRGSK